MLWCFALCYAISCIISERFDWFAWFFYLWAIPFAPLLLLYGFVLKPFWMFFRHVLWFSREKLHDFAEKYPLTNREQKNGKPWIKVLNKHYNGKEVKKRYAYCLTFIK